MVRRFVSGMHLWLTALLVVVAGCRTAAPPVSSPDPCQAGQAELSRRRGVVDQQIEKQKNEHMDARAATKKTYAEMGDLHRTAGHEARDWEVSGEEGNKGLEKLLGRIVKRDCAARLVSASIGTPQRTRPTLIGQSARLVVSASGLSLGSCLVREVWSLGRMVSVDSLRLAVDARGKAKAELRFTIWRRDDEHEERAPSGEKTSETPPRCADLKTAQQAMWLALDLNQLAFHRAGRDRAVARLATLRALKSQLERQKSVLTLLDGLVTADPAPALLALTPRSLAISGTVRTATAYRALKAAKITHGTVDTSGVVHPPRPVVDPSKLARWPTPKGPGPKAARFQLHAQEADGDAVQMLLSGRRRGVLTRSARGIRVTGRVESGDRGAALAALLARYKALSKDAFAMPAAAWRRWRGRKVDLSFMAASAPNVLRLLAEVGAINLVHRPLSAGLTIQLRGAPWDWVLHTVAARLNLFVQKSGSVWFLRSRSSAVPAVQRFGKGRVDLSLFNVKAADAIALLATAGPVPMSASCSSATPVNLRLRNARPTAALAAIGFLSGAKLEPSKPGGRRFCPAGGGPGRLALRGLLSGRGIKSAALVRTTKGKLQVVQRGDLLGEERVVRILQPDRVVLKKAGGMDRILSVEAHGSGDSQAPPVMRDGRREVPDLRGMRLSFTMIDGARRLAMFESEAGERTRWFDQIRYNLDISAGQVKIERRVRMGYGAPNMKRSEVHRMRPLP
jgi:hypothetical protein